MVSKYLRILGDDWDAIRDKFTEDEKKSLRECTVSTSLCPAMATINNERISPELLKKLTRLLASLVKK